MRLTSQQYAAIQAKRHNTKTAVHALGRLKSGEMNKTEARYSQHLEQLKMMGDVLWFKFDCINLRLADKTFYKPDFLVMFTDGRLEIHEVKGHWEDDAKVKIKVAASIFPFIFKAVYWQKGCWVYQDF